MSEDDNQHDVQNDAHDQSSRDEAVGDQSSDGENNQNDDDLFSSGPTTSSVRIAAVEAAVAAGLAPSVSRLDATDAIETIDVNADQPNVVELPAWTDPPTGQVPRVLLSDDDSDDLSYATRGPSWREDSSDWDGDIDLSIFAADVEVDESAEIAGQEIPLDDLHPYTFGDLGLSGEQPVVVVDDEDDDTAWAAVLGETQSDESDDYGLASFGPSHLNDRARRSRRHGGAHRAKSTTPSEQAEASVPKRVANGAEVTSHGAPTKSAAIATVTGLVAAAIAVVCFLFGSVSTLVLVTVAVMVAAGELYAVLRRVGFSPATLPGLVIVGALPVGAYLRGSSAFPVVLSIGFIAIGLWYLSGRGGERAAVNIGATCGVIIWIGVLSSFAGLLLSPSAHPHRHGVALLLGVIVITVAHDIGSYAVGAKLGRHKLAPNVSPNKSIEGLIGGTIVCLVVAGFLVSRIHPMGTTFAIELGIAVAIFAPLGDLVESLVKRDLSVKDMGNLLPGHGGILDRIDAMLFVLPMTYFLASMHHLS